MRTELENKFTSTPSKMLQHPYILQEMIDGIFRPVSLQLAPTDKCNLNCAYCSVKDREMNEINLDDLMIPLQQLRILGLKTVEITGGGDPTCYNDIVELISLCKVVLGLKVGLITNGVLLKSVILQENLDKLEWVRISLNFDQVKDIDLDGLKFKTLGFSFVWQDSINRGTLEKIDNYAEKYNAEYVRVVPNCLDTETIAKQKKVVPDLIKDFPKFFFQTKEYTLPERCWMGYIKPFLNSDGYFYHCSANPLIDRKFNENFRMGHMSEVNKIWENPKPFDTQHCQDGKCFFKAHNDLIENLLIKHKHGDFI